MEINKEYLENTFTTSKYLDEKLSDFATKDYLDKKLYDFATKDYLDENFASKTSLKEVKTTVDEIKEIVDRLDKRDREDSDFFSKMLINHDKRIAKLEKASK